jgi:hypothetical protein
MNRILYALVGAIAAKSRRLRKFVPLLPVALAVFEYLKKRQDTRGRLHPPLDYAERPGAFSRRAVPTPSPSFR